VSQCEHLFVVPFFKEEGDVHGGVHDVSERVCQEANAANTRKEE
jgi:hypothetical protein